MAQNSPEIDLYMCEQLIFDQGTKAVPWRKYCFSTNGAGIIDYP